MPRKKATKTVPEPELDSDETFENESESSFYSNKAASAIDVKECQIDECEKKIITALDDATEKSAQTRTKALQIIVDLLMHRYIPDVVASRKVTMMDCLEKGLRRGKGAEQELAARIVPLMVAQLDGEEEVPQVLTPFLLKIMQDKTVPYQTRTNCCEAVALAFFLSGGDYVPVVQMMKSFENIYSGSYQKGDGKVPTTINADVGNYHAAAIASWSLLLTMIPERELIGILFSSHGFLANTRQFLSLLQSPNLDVRMATGESLALIAELCRSHETSDDNDNDDEHSQIDKLVEDALSDIRNLATDSKKHRAKRDRKAQRATFRDVLQFLEEGTQPDLSVRFGDPKFKQETIKLDSWEENLIYSTICGSMGPGITSHLKENPFVRDIFALGPPFKIVHSHLHQMEVSQLKIGQKARNTAASKARTLERTKNRDRRFDFE